MAVEDVSCPSGSATSDASLAISSEFAPSTGYCWSVAYEAGESTDPYALLDWYLSAEFIIRDLDACHVVADAMLCGSATPNLLATGA